MSGFLNTITLHMFYPVIRNGDLGVYAFSSECGGGLTDRRCPYEIPRLHGLAVLEGMLSGGMHSITSSSQAKNMALKSKKNLI
uniref:Uncharacterized protein n=1 Tax=Magallana gigas TaxID=29159 RepID=K1QTV8_MAGGI